MKRNQSILLAFVFGGALAASAAQAGKADDKQQSVSPDYLQAGGTRKFSIEYVGQVQNIPAGTRKVRVWMPAPQSSTVQTIKQLQFAPKAFLTIEPKYLNLIAYWEFVNPPSSIRLKMSFICTRRETRADLQSLAADGQEAAGKFDVYKKPDRLVIVDEEIRQLARAATAGQSNTLGKARAIYSYVLNKMSYDKNHDGWGQGSTRHAREVWKGNCTDFHALFNSLCRAEGIASGFEIGLYLPYQAHQAEALDAYHCWAFFRVPGKTWVPVDCAEGALYAERREYFFGNHTANRVTLSTGRDLILEPRPAGPPLNYFVDPYGEADGQTVPTEKNWTFRDLD
ncbi:MAG TPA: transglutaminase domain-containing protein [Verrucomicrobiae bacterium]|nr:transglutaminase domain-containing protein [Verrucomicrobiae bacterium]